MPECTKLQNPRYKDVTLKAYTSQQEQKLSLKSIVIEQCVGVFFFRIQTLSADTSKSQEISRWWLIVKALHCNFSVTKNFFQKIATIFYQKDSRSFQQCVQKEVKRSILQDYDW